jgi:hypothetical protein
MTLTPEQRRQADRAVTRTTRIGQTAAVATFALLLAAIWGGDWRFAATAALVFPGAVFSLYLAGRLRRVLAETEDA